jgi:hypothetical protein
VAKKLRIDPQHGKYPSDDFKEIIELIPEEIRKKAVKWYKMGIKRGFAKATDMMLDGEIYKKGNTVYCPNRFEIRVKTKFSSEPWVKRKIEIKADDIGFE